MAILRWYALFWVAALLGAAALVTANNGAAEPLFTPAASGTAQPKQVDLCGCLYTSKDKTLVFAPDQDEDSREFRLIGNTAALTGAFFMPVHIRGIETSQGRPPDSEGTIKVIEAKILKPIATMNPSFRDPARWHEESSATYGIRFAIPKEQSEVNLSAQDFYNAEPSFPRQDGAHTFFRTAFPNDMYPESDWTGGDFSLSVNTKIIAKPATNSSMDEQTVHSSRFTA